MQTRLSTPATFDSENKYVTSYLVSPTVLGCVRLLFGSYALTTNIVILIWTGVVSGDADAYVLGVLALLYNYFDIWSCAGISLTSPIYHTSASLRGCGLQASNRSLFQRLRDLGDILVIHSNHGPVRFSFCMNCSSRPLLLSVSHFYRLTPRLRER